jgi:DNA-binding NarL/FixJ family response regulator
LGLILKRVLLVDDSAVVRRTLRQIFEDAGWTVSAEASNGEEAVAKAQQVTADVIILDLSMPAMNGLTAGSILKNMFPRTPLILFTSFGNVLSSVELHRAGFSALVEKTDAGKLVAAAENLLSPH